MEDKVKLADQLEVELKTPEDRYTLIVINQDSSQADIERDIIGLGLVEYRMRERLSHFLKRGVKVVTFTIRKE